MNFIDDGAIQAADHAHRVLARGEQREFIIQRQVAQPVLSHLAHERGLARLAWTSQKNHGRVGHGFCDTWLNPTGEQRGRVHRRMLS